MSDERTKIIHEWMQAEAARKAWAERETQLRLFIAAQFGYNHEMQGSIDDGTHRIDLGNGYKLKLVTGTEWYAKDGHHLRTVLDAVLTLPEPLSKPLVKWKPTLSLTAMRELPPHLSSYLQPAITTKNKMPTLELESPK